MPDEPVAVRSDARAASGEGVAAASEAAAAAQERGDNGLACATASEAAHLVDIGNLLLSEGARGCDDGEEGATAWQRERERGREGERGVAGSGQLKSERHRAA